MAPNWTETKCIQIHDCRCVHKHNFCKATFYSMDLMISRQINGYFQRILKILLDFHSIYKVSFMVLCHNNTLCRLDSARKSDTPMMMMMMMICRKRMSPTFNRTVHDKYWGWCGILYWLSYMLSFVWCGFCLLFVMRYCVRLTNGFFVWLLMLLLLLSLWGKFLFEHIDQLIELCGFPWYALNVNTKSNFRFNPKTCQRDT